MSRAFFWKYVFITLALAAGAFVLGRTTARQSSESAPRAAITGPEAAGQSVPDRTLARPAPSSDATAIRSGDQFRSALKQLDLATGCEQREDKRLQLLIAWADSDPPAALEYAKQNLKADRLAQAMSGIATEWAKNNPAAAWNWACSLGSNDTSQAHTVLEQVARDNPTLASQFATEFAEQNPDNAVAICLTAMRGMAYDGNFAAALQLANQVQLRSPDDQAVLLNFMAGEWARFQPEQAAAWVESLPAGQDRNQALIGLGESWAEVDPPQAADFAAKLPAGAQREMALQQAIGNWVLADPAAARTWIANNDAVSTPDFDQAVATVATMNYLVTEHVDIALQWAESISSESLRNAALGQIISNWALRDRTAALSYAQSSPGLSPEIRQRLLGQLQSGAP